MNNIESIEIGKRIAELRKKLNMSQRQLAEKVGINYGYIAKIELGKHNVGVNTICRIMSFFNITLKINNMDRTITNDQIYSVISAMADYLCNNDMTMTFSQLAVKLSIFFDYDFVAGRGMASRVKGAYNSFDGEKQDNIAKAFINENGEYAYE